MNSSGGDGASSSDCSRSGQRGRVGHQHAKPLAERAIADLVVVLQEVDERRGRQMRARLAARRATFVR